MSIVMNTNYS